MLRRIDTVKALNEIKKNVQSNKAAYIAGAGGLLVGMLIISRRPQSVVQINHPEIFHTHPIV